MKKSILSAKGISKSFAHNGEHIPILSHLDFELYEGDFTVIMGASGSGKSTLLYALSGMDRPTAGQVIYGERDLTVMKEKELASLRCKEFGFIFQQMHLISNLSLSENVLVSGYLNKNYSASEVKKRTEDLFDKMGLVHVKKHLPSQVSGGEQQRCAIARAVVNMPKILFADEPTGALNRHNTMEVLNLLSELNNSGQSILMVTHDLKAALRATRLLYLEDGMFVGEMALSTYSHQEEKARETQINAWLASMEW
ncbi:MAG: ABC transporter ATP-binding protein [Lachnospiraceae bacterium]|jgi:putative ABC transport system ATP-binding protein|nr:ABC transporter ATP-binding protein [Lachnospiraceae bacterium]